MSKCKTTFQVFHTYTLDLKILIFKANLKSWFEYHRQISKPNHKKLGLDVSIGWYTIIKFYKIFIQAYGCLFYRNTASLAAVQ